MILTQYLYNDRFRTFDSDLWRVAEDADYDELEQDVLLTENTASQNGRLISKEPLVDRNWTVDWSIQFGAGTATQGGRFGFWWYTDTAVNTGFTPDDGYGIVFDHTTDTLKLVRYVDSTELTLTSRNTTINTDENTTTRLRVRYLNGDITVRKDGVDILQYEIEFDEIDTSLDQMMFSAETDGSNSVEQRIDNAKMIVPTNLSLRQGLKVYQQGGLYVGPESNNRRLIRAMNGIIESLAIDTQEVLESHHIRTAKGPELDKLGQAVDVTRRTGESDDAYRLRIILAFRINSVDGTFDELAQFAGVVFDTDPENLQFETNFDALPATITLRADSSIVASSPLEETDITDLLSDVVIAGHRVLIETAGTFVLIDDSDPVSDFDTGLTGDADLSTGGTLTGDLA